MLTAILVSGRWGCDVVSNLSCFITIGVMDDILQEDVMMEDLLQEDGMMTDIHTSVRRDNG